MHPCAKDKRFINSSQNADLNVRIMHEVNRKNSELVHYFVLDTHFLSRTQVSLAKHQNESIFIYTFIFCHFSVQQRWAQHCKSTIFPLKKEQDLCLMQVASSPAHVEVQE